MVDTFQAVAVAAIAVLPGSLYVWAFERLVGRWGIGSSDRLLRFVGGSAFFHATFAPLTYFLWSQFFRTGTVSAGKPLPYYLWAVVLGYVSSPLALGSIVGWGTREGRSWAKWFTGPEPAPRAWDHLFGRRPEAWVRLKIKNGPWLGGIYSPKVGLGSYAAGYPEPADIFLSEGVEVDPHSGRFLFDDAGQPRRTNSGLLVRWEQTEYLEVIDV